MRACGTRFVSHKVAGISRLLDRYGAYITHLTTLTEDYSVREIDKQKLKGYVLKWRDCKMILGCALFHDILKPAAVMCKTLQYDEICVVSAIESTLKTSKAIESLRCNPFKRACHAYNLVIGRGRQRAMGAYKRGRALPEVIQAASNGGRIQIHERSFSLLGVFTLSVYPRVSTVYT